MPDRVYDKVSRSGALTVTAGPDAQSSCLGRVPENLFPRHDPLRKNDIRLAANVFRCAPVSDLSAEGLETGIVAGAIGESGAETVKWYGKRRGTGGRRAD